MWRCLFFIIGLMGAHGFFIFNAMLKFCAIEFIYSFFSFLFIST
jgi:hypothetical protein